MRKEITKIALVGIFSILVIGFIFSYGDDTLAINDDSQTEISQNGHRAKFVFTIKGSGKNKLIEPLNVVVSKDGLIYISDKGDGLIKIFDLKGKFQKKIGSSETKKSFKYPYGMVITSKGKLWVSDPEISSVKQFDLETGEFTKEIKFPEGVRPGLMTTDKSNLIYISDLLGKRILIYNEDGKKKGQIKANFSFPQGLAVDNNKNLWIGDAGKTPSLKVLNSEGSLLDQIDLDNENKSYFTTIRGLAIDSKSNIFITDPMAHKILVFNLKGELIFQLGTNGTKNYQFSFPTGLFIDGNDRIYIADRMNKRIQVWTYQGGVK